jgi:hypothetical protein
VLGTSTFALAAASLRSSDRPLSLDRDSFTFSTPLPLPLPLLLDLRSNASFSLRSMATKDLGSLTLGLC